MDQGYVHSRQADTDAPASPRAGSALPFSPDRPSLRPGARRRHRSKPLKLYRIGEVVEYAGLSRQTIHNYTTMGLLCEKQWSPGGHRLYDESVFERLDKIAELKSQRRSLGYIREHFAHIDAPPTPPATNARPSRQPEGE